MRALFFSSLAVLVSATLLSGTARAAPSAARPATESVWLQSNLRELYPRRAELCLSTYEQMSDTAGVVLQLQSDLDRLSGFRYTIRRDSLRREPPRVSRSGRVSLVFDSRSPRPQRIEAVIEAVSSTGETTRPYSVVLGYYPREYYAASGHGTPTWIVVHTSDIHLCSGSVDDWIVEHPSAEDRAYARKRWSRLVSPYGTDLEKAKAIARDLVRTLRPHEGIPSDRMTYASGFEQLARAESGQDRVWCGNYADIFSTACNALDIPVRKIDMQYVWSSGHKVNFEIGEAHRTTEVFDRKLNQWVWMDLTLGYWAALGNGQDPLNMAELVQVLADERRLPRLRLVEYDHASGVERVVPVSESSQAKDLFRFFRQDQRYHYVRSAHAAIN